MHDDKLCPKVEAAFALIAKKWNGLLIQVLMNGPKRFSEIRGLIPELSDKVLADKLKELESADMLKRLVYAETPVRVEYALTEKAKALKPAFAAIGEWASKWA